MKIEHVRYNIVATLNSLSLCLSVSHIHSVLLYLLTGSTKHLPPALDLSAATEVWPLVLSVILGLISVSACSVIASGSASPLGQQWSQYPTITPKPLRLPLLGWTCVCGVEVPSRFGQRTVCSAQLFSCVSPGQAQILTSNQRHSGPLSSPPCFQTSGARVAYQGVGLPFSAPLVSFCLVCTSDICTAKSHDAGLPTALL